MGSATSKIRKTRHERVPGETDQEKRENFAAMTSSFAVAKTVKLLLAGTGECGKTTILRRVMLAYGPESSLKDQQVSQRGIILYNIVEGADLVLTVLKRLYNSRIEDEFKPQEEVIDSFMDKYKTQELRIIDANLTQPVVDAILTLVKQSRRFSKTLSKRHEYGLFNNWDWFVQRLEDFPEFGGDSWMPSISELLHSRVRSTGLASYLFEDSGRMNVELIDIGGQRTERRKFLFMLAQVDVIVYVASMADYCEKMFEDAKANRLIDSLQNLKGIYGRPEMTGKWVLIFVNKFDLFKVQYKENGKKIPKGFKKYGELPPLATEDDEECMLAQEWFKKLFKAQIPESNAKCTKIYITSALDDNNIHLIMQYAMNLIFHNSVDTVS